jgi:hypothetical protein
MTDHTVQLRLEDAPRQHEMLSPDPLIVRLNKVFSWQQSPSRWPYYLSRAEPGRIYSKEEIAVGIFGDERGQQIEGKGWLTSIYGFRIDRQHEEVVIEGLGVFERVDPAADVGYRLSEDGYLLAKAYSADRASDDWKRIFAGILARNDVRIRCVLLHLGRWQALLTFDQAVAPDDFFVPSRRGALRFADGTQHPLFDVSTGRPSTSSFTALLRRDPIAMLGSWLRARIQSYGVRVPDNVVFEGGRSPLGRTSRTYPEPSANNLRDYMKQALSLFRDVGALVYVPHRQGWTLERQRCATVFDPAVVADLFGGAQEDDFLNGLRAAYTKLSDDEGLVRVADIRDYVCDALDIPVGDRVDYFNQQVAYYLRPDIAKVSIGRTFHHQAGPSDCLFGDPSREYVQFIFAPS